MRVACSLRRACRPPWEYHVAASSADSAVVAAMPMRSMRAPARPRGRSAHTLAISEERLHEFLRAEVAYFATQEPNSISVREIIDARTPQLVAELAAKELPVRFAHRLLQMESLVPINDSCQPILEVHSLYFKAFRDLRLTDCEPAQEDFTKFTNIIQLIKRRMQLVIPRLAMGIRELQQTRSIDEAFIQEWLDTFFLSRIGTEMITSQYMSTVSTMKKRGKAGIVNNLCDPAAICEQAARHVKKLCKQHFSLKTNNVRILIETQVCESMSDTYGRIRFPYIPQYLFYIMVELLKNSTRATVESINDESRLHEKPIVITIGADHGHVAIRVSDQALGIPFSVADRVWSYMYSTAKKRSSGSDYMTEGTPLAGYGVGLPLSRLYARYLGGSLSLMSMPGIGTNAYLYLKRIETDAREEVPGSLSSLSSLSSLAELDQWVN